MRNLLSFVVIASFTAAAGAQEPVAPAAPATSATAVQTAPAQAAPPAEKPKMIKKKVCERVDNEETTGSRVGSAPRVCTIVTVPASGKDERGR